MIDVKTLLPGAYVESSVWNLTGFEYLVVSLVVTIVLLFVPVRGQRFPR
jgi:hypothetical protein